MKKYFFLAGCCFLLQNARAQKQKADSLSKLLVAKNTDTTQIKYMLQKANYLYNYAPDSTILIAQQALLLSKQVNYTEGESKALGQMANGFLSIGNYPKALEFYIRRLQLEEKRNNPYNLAGTTMNIGLVYVYEGEYEKAIFYMRKADSLITVNKIDNLAYQIKLNIGDVFDKQNISDSAFIYFTNAYKIALTLMNDNRIGMALTGLGHTYLKQHKFEKSLQQYTEGLSYLKRENNEDIMCEASLGLANLYKQTNKYDSAVWHARFSFLLAQQAGFPTRQLDASIFLTDLYSNIKINTDSAFAYLRFTKTIGDSINSKQKIRELQMITMNEQLRQEEIAANLKKQKKERSQQLQLLLIGLFIPVLFLITLLLSKIKVPAKVVRFLGVLSLLILFEYLTLLLHPRVVEFTHHTPFFELLIFVAIASLLIPTHHRIEHWLIEKLTFKKNSYAEGNFKLKRQRLKIKKTL